LNEADIADVQSFSADLMKLAGQRVTFDLLRDDQPRTIAVMLNP
jgi:S1-C subfamily serine protease